MRQMLAAQQAAQAAGRGAGRRCGPGRRGRAARSPPAEAAHPPCRLRRGRPADLGQPRPQRRLPLRLGREVQALPRPSRLTTAVLTRSADNSGVRVANLASDSVSITQIMPFLRPDWALAVIGPILGPGHCHALAVQKVLRISAALGVAFAAAHTAERLKAPAGEQSSGGRRADRADAGPDRVPRPEASCRRSASLTRSRQAGLGDLVGITSVAATTPAAGRRPLPAVA